MKINTKPKYNIKVIILSFFVILCAASIIMYVLAKQKNESKNRAESSNQQRVNQVDYSSPSDEQSNPATDTIDSVNKEKNPLNVTITSANQANGTMQVRALITPIVSSGLCTLQLLKDGSETIEKTAPIQNLSSSSTCQGFDIAIGTLEPGTWSLSLKVETDTESGTVTKQVVIE